MLNNMKKYMLDLGKEVTPKVVIYVILDLYKKYF